VFFTGNACKHAYALELSSMELINSKFYMSWQVRICNIECMTKNILVSWLYRKAPLKVSVLISSLTSISEAFFVRSASHLATYLQVRRNI
jgi:hypothetical protein